MSKCKARQYSDQMHCAACGLTWDMNDPDPPQCAPRAAAPVIDIAKSKGAVSAAERARSEVDRIVNQPPFDPPLDYYECFAHDRGQCGRACRICTREGRNVA